VRDEALAPCDDPFVLLGVQRSAPPAEIKQAFRREARRLHPDVCTDPDAPEKFRKVVTSYNILSDDSRRAAWISSDAFRRQSRSAAPAPEEPRPWMFELADTKWVRVALTCGFVGGQWLSWWAFLYGMAHMAAPAQAMCGLGPCIGM